MAKSDSKSAIQRGLLLYDLISPVQKTAKQFHQELVEQGYDVSLRTVERDLARLVEVFPAQINYIRKFPPFGYKLRDGRKKSNMSPNEAVSLLIAHEYLEPLIPKIVQNLRLYIEEAKATIKTDYSINFRQWQKKIYVKNEGFQLMPNKIDLGVLSSIHSALFNGHCISAEYFSRAAQKVQQFNTLYPIGLVHTGRILYLVGSFDEGMKGLFYFPIQRFRSVKPSPATNSLSHVDVKDLIQDGLLGFKLSQQTIKIKLRFNESSGFIFYETPISKQQIIRHNKNGFITIEDAVQDTLELRNWLCAFGDNVEVLAPLSLRQEIKEKLENAVKNYGN